MEILESIKKVTLEINDLKFKKKALKEETDQVLERDNEYKKLSVEFLKQKKAKHYRELEVLNEYRSGYLIEKKDELSKQMKELNGILSSLLGQYLKESGVNTVDLGDGKSIEVISKFFLKPQQMRLFN